MKRRWLGPMSDLLFKRIFGEEKDIMIELINSVIHPDNRVVDLEFLQPELIPQFQHDKLTIVDVRCRDKSNRTFLVEMQILLNKGFHERVFYNATKVYGKQLEIGESVSLLKPVYAICFVFESIEPDEQEWVHRYEMRRNVESSTEFNAITMIFVEIAKFQKIIKFDLENPLHRWIRFLAEPDYVKHLPMEKKHDYPNLKKASVILDEATLTPPQQYGYDLYLDNIRTWNATMVESFDEGFDEGMEKGIEKGMEKGIEKGVEKGIEKGADLTIAILGELRRSKKTIEQIAQEFNVKIDLVKKLNDLL